MVHTAIIGLGSNINPNENIHRALEFLKRIADVKKISKIVITKPIGITDQPDFHNGAVLINTIHEEDMLKLQLKAIEDQLGRDRSRPKFGPREIDLDIVVFDNMVVDEDYHQRDFLQEVVDSIWL
nr:2-amino-4-hydroxy-6-hydroxymethyldihydropteridine diphosphokinase [uncultured Carboxylicivirga sp.]